MGITVTATDVFSPSINRLNSINKTWTLIIQVIVDKDLLSSLIPTNRSIMLKLSPI